MSKLNYNNTEDSNGINGDILGIISTFCVMFCMIVTILGIKFKWFKHRMNFEQIPQSDNTNNNNTNNSINNGGDKFRNTSENRLSLTTMQGHGVFRKLQDDEIPIERPKTLPPIRIKNTSRQQQLHCKPSKLTNHQSNEQIPKSENHEIFKNMKFNAFPTDSDLLPKVHHHQQKTNSKLRQDRSKSPKKNISPTIQDNSQLSKNQSPTRQHRSKSPQKQQQQLKENSVVPSKSSNDKRIKKSPNSLKLDIEVTKKTIEKVKPSKQIEKQKEEKNVKFVDNSPEQINENLQTDYLEEINLNDNENLKEISSRRPTGFVRPTKEELDELENFDNIIDEIDQQYPGTLHEKHGQVVFKIDGFSDNEDEKNSIKIIPKPEPRITIRKSFEKDLQNDEMSSNLMPLASLNNDQNNNNNNENDSWSAVRQHRNLTQEMAKHHQAIRDAAQIKAAKRQLKNPLAYDLNQKSNLNGTEDDKYQKHTKNDNSIHHLTSNDPRISNNSTEA